MLPSRSSWASEQPCPNSPGRGDSIQPGARAPGVRRRGSQSTRMGRQQSQMRLLSPLSGLGFPVGLTTLGSRPGLDAITPIGAWNSPRMRSIPFTFRITLTSRLGVSPGSDATGANAQTAGKTIGKEFLITH